ncbi:MAG: DUF308 domain-containing protein [Blautia sp.]|nr:DUF308 domain-containing protein [Blautia sp.]
MKSILRNYIVDAFLLILLGIFMLLKPNHAMDFVIRVAGAVHIIMGAAKTILFIRDQEERSVFVLMLGVLQIVLGIVLLANPALFAGIYTMAWGIIIAYGAVVSLAELVRVRKYDVSLFTPAIVLSLVTLVLAIVVILHPGIVAKYITQLIGISVIVEGVSLLLALTRYKRRDNYVSM